MTLNRAFSCMAFLIELTCLTTLSASDLPDAKQRQLALGEVQELGPVAAALLQNESLFLPKSFPDADDWIAQHPEPKQSFADFLNDRPPAPSPDSQTLYLLPLEDTKLDEVEQVLILEYCRIFFNTQVKLLPPLQIDERTIRRRHSRLTGQAQLHGGDLIKKLGEIVPTDSYALIAFTTIDLYPDENWNFVFGLADLRRGLGVFSFARYGDKSENRSLYLERALKVMSHEIGHMYGLRHCQYYECLMNGSNSLTETDQAPLHLCPICLRKLHHMANFDFLRRYTALRDFYQENGYSGAAAIADAQRKLALQILLEP